MKKTFGGITTVFSQSDDKIPFFYMLVWIRGVAWFVRLPRYVSSNLIWKERWRCGSGWCQWPQLEAGHPRNPAASEQRCGKKLALVHHLWLTGSGNIASSADEHHTHEVCVCVFAWEMKFERQPGVDGVVPCG